LPGRPVFAIQGSIGRACGSAATEIQQRTAFMAISKELLEILACPKCKGDITLTDAGDGLVCDNCRLLYEIKDDIPIMLIDEAKPLD
jgi:uncharacterized protein YbaR (Trm112 family)